MSLARHKRDWEELAAVDPLWAVLSDPAHRRRGWDLDAFLETGEREVDELLARGRELGLPARLGRALDFGCGAGRVTRALGARFDCCVGVDISERMVAEARRLAAGRGCCAFVVNETEHLRRFPDASFDLVYSRLVLQHLPNRRLVAGYVEEFVRLVAPDGVAVFELPPSVGLLHRLQSGRRLYAILRRLGVSQRFLLGRTPLTPMRMQSAPEGWVRHTVSATGGSVVAVDGAPGGSLLYWAARSSL